MYYLLGQEIHNLFFISFILKKCSPIRRHSHHWTCRGTDWSHLLVLHKQVPILQMANKMKPQKYQKVIVVVTLEVDDYFLSHSDRELQQTLLTNPPKMHPYTLYWSDVPYLLVPLPSVPPQRVVGLTPLRSIFAPYNFAAVKQLWHG